MSPPTRLRAPARLGAATLRVANAACAGAICLLAVAGCAGGGLVGDTYMGDGYMFTVQPPRSDWQRLDIEGANLAYRSDTHQATMLINGRCGRNTDDVPLTALTNHLFFQFTDREVIKQETVPFDGREAMHTVMDAKLDGVALRYDVWVLKKDNCVYDLLFLAPATSFDGGHADFQAVVQGFTASREGEP